MEGGSALGSVLRVLLALIGVSGLAWVVLAMLARRGLWGAASRVPARVRVLERVVLSPRRQLYLVQADARVFLLGAGEAGPPSLIAELEAEPTLPLRAAGGAEAAS